LSAPTTSIIMRLQFRLLYWSHGFALLVKVTVIIVVVIIIIII